MCVAVGSRFARCVVFAVSNALHRARAADAVSVNPLSSNWKCSMFWLNCPALLYEIVREYVFVDT